MRLIWIIYVIIYLAVKMGANGQINSNQGQIMDQNGLQQQNGLTKDWPMGTPPPSVQVPNTERRV